MRNRYKWIMIAILVAGLGLVMGIGMLVDRQSARNNQADTSLVESNVPLVFSPTNNLSVILLDRQFNGFYQTISSYLSDKFGSGVKGFGLVDNAKVANDGSVGFKIQLQPSGEIYGVNIDRSQLQNIIITIPELKYRQSVEVYSP